MDVTLALQRAVKAFPLGTPALAAHLGISQTSLLHKVSPSYAGSHCSPEEMLDIMEATGDDGPLEAMASRRGKLLLPAPQIGDDGTAMSHTLAACVREFGEFVAEVAADLCDGKVKAVELRRIEREGAEALAAIHKLLQLASAMHEAGKPVALRPAA